MSGLTLVVIVYVLFFVSLLSYILTAIFLYKSKRNPLIFLFCIAGIVICLSALSSLLYDHPSVLQNAVQTNFTNQPSKACFVQGAMIQIPAYMTAITATCFSYHTYRVLVKQRPDDLFGKSMNMIYYILISGYTVGMGTMVLVLATQFKAIQPLLIICDIKDPGWIRLIGFSGSNLLVCIPGVYWSTTAAIIVLRHADRFKSHSTSNKASANSDNDLISEANNGTVTEKTSSPATTAARDQNQVPELPVNARSSTDRRYNITRKAGVRMVVFSVSFLFVNLLASVQTILDVWHDREIDPLHVRAPDIAGSTTGIFVLAIFGTGVEARRFIRGLKQWVYERAT